MTKEELKKQLDVLWAEEEREVQEQASRGPIGLDGPIAKKYRNLRKELLANYEQEKED